MHTHASQNKVLLTFKLDSHKEGIICLLTTLNIGFVNRLNCGTDFLQFVFCKHCQLDILNLPID